MKLILPEFNASAIALEYYKRTHPERIYCDARRALVNLKQDKALDKKVLKEIVRDFHDRQQKHIANYFAQLQRF